MSAFVDKRSQRNLSVEKHNVTQVRTYSNIININSSENNAPSQYVYNMFTSLVDDCINKSHSFGWAEWQTQKEKYSKKCTQKMNKYNYTGQSG